MWKLNGKLNILSILSECNLCVSGLRTAICTVIVNSWTLGHTLFTVKCGWCVDRGQS
jgi:hypothetical protein